MRTAATILAAIALSACQAQQPGEAAFQGTSYGEPLTLTEVTQVSAILDDPGHYVGERVLVKGMIVEVCEMRGCWMDIASDRDFEKIKIKVDDGVIVFPLSARGSEALVEGIVEELQLTAEEAIEAARHHAEEQGEEFDPSSVPEGPQTIYQIRGIGAVVAD
jgi:hypothetical protein